MRKMKHIVVFILAMALAFAMTATAFASEPVILEGNYSITINNGKADHTYEAYQIFTGTLAKKDNRIYMTNIGWGADIREEKRTTLLSFNVSEAYADPASLVESFTDPDTGEVILSDIQKELLTETVKACIDDTPCQRSTKNGETYIISDLAPGYYLIKDQDGSMDGKNDTYTSYILKVYSSVDFTAKNVTNLPTVDKKVQDEAEDAEADHADGWGETADHSMFESFQFKLIANIPADTQLSHYASYKITFVDKMSKGITFESIESVTVNGSLIDRSKYFCDAAAGQKGPAEWKLTIADLKGLVTDLTDGVDVEVIYNAQLNEEAEAGDTTANRNEVKLLYSNNPNAGFEDNMGETNTDTVWVFTYKMDNSKVGDGGKPLTGAGFRLYNDEGCTSEISLIFDAGIKAYRPTKTGEAGEEMLVQIDSATGESVFNIKGLDAGTYYIKETTVPAGYNSLKSPIKVEISAVHQESADTTTASTQITMTMNGELSDKNIIVNIPGATLPSAGGMGTTLFYVVGGILVLAAAVLLIIRLCAREKKRGKKR